MKEVKCAKCGKGLGFFRHDKHLLIINPILECEECNYKGSDDE
jgi:DNA-directed RNA polymerase subunit RPC12/RpoP